MANVLDTITLDFRRIWQLTLQRPGGSFLACAIGGGAGNSSAPFEISDEDASHPFVHLDYATSLPEGHPPVGSLVQVKFTFGGTEYSGENTYQPAKWIARIFTYVVNAYAVPYAVLENVDTGEWIIALLEEMNVIKSGPEPVGMVAAVAYGPVFPKRVPRGHKDEKKK